MDVAVVIPAYNAEQTLGRTLESVLAQTAAVREIVVVDDGSRDGTRALVESFRARNGDRVRLLTQANGGPSRARNLGVAETAAECIAFLDADDAWEAEKIALQVEAMEAAPAAVLCYTGLRNVTPDDVPLEEVRPAAPGTLEERLRLGNPHIVPSCVMVRREAFERVGGFQLKLRGSEDWELWLRLLREGPFCVVEAPLTRYTVSNTGLSADADHMFAEAESMVEPYLLDGLSGWRRWLWRRRILAFQAYKAALTARAAGQHGREMQYILRSFGWWPSPAWESRRAKVLAVSLRDRMQGRQARGE